MSAFFTFLAIALVVLIAWAAVVTLSWALTRGAEIIERQDRE